MSLYSIKTERNRMKKLLFVILTPLLSIATAYGDNTAKYGLPKKFGVTLTPFLIDNIAQVAYSNKGKVQRSIPVQLKLGAWGEYTFSDLIGGQISLEFLQVENLSLTPNAPSKETPENSVTADLLESRYLVLKVKPHFYIHDNFCCFIGPQVTRLFSSKRQDYIDGVKDGAPVYSEDPKTTWDLFVGLNYKFKNDIQLGVEYTAGFDSDTVRTNKTFLSSLTLSYDLAKLLKKNNKLMRKIFYS